MRITDVRAVQPETPGSPPDWRTQLGQIVVRIDTDQACFGMGVGGGGKAGVHVIETVLRDVLLGQDAADVESLHDEMFDATRFYGRSGLVVMAISGVDLALWDLRGKMANQSVAAWLGAEDPGRPLPTYATVWGDKEAEEEIRGGARAIKLHVERFGDRPDPSEIAELVAATRKRLGPEAEIMMDAFGRWDLDSTLRVDEAIADFGVAWIEEPLPPDDETGYETLTHRCGTPIAGGEHEYGVAAFRRLIELRLHHVLQPDVNWCGGLTTLLRIYEMANQAGLRVCPHRGSEPFAVPALLTVDPAPLAESPRRWFQCWRNNPRIERGLLFPAQRPGFGLDPVTEWWGE